MPRQARGPYLWLRPARQRPGRGAERAVWIIKDGRDQHSTRCGEGDRRGAEAELLATSHRNMPRRAVRAVSTRSRWPT
jgi:hypothetical protein